MVDTKRTLSTLQTSFADNATGNITAQNLRDFLVSVYTDWVDVKAYGAVGDDATNDTTAIQNAINAVEAGGTVFFPPGTYRVTSFSALNSKAVRFKGASRDNAIIRTTSATATVFDCDNFNITFEDLKIDSSTTRTAGALIKFNTNGSNGSVLRCQIEKYFTGIEIAALAFVVVRDTNIRDGATGAGGSGILVTGGNAHVLDNVQMDASAAAQPACAVRVQNVGALNISNCGFIHHTNDMIIEPGNGQSVASVYSQNTYFDTATRGLYINPAGTGTVLRLKFTNCWFCGHSSDGVTITAQGGWSGTMAGIEFHNCEFNSNGADGIGLSKGTGVQVVGGTASANTGDAIGVAAGIGNFQIIGIKANDQLSANGGYGVAIANGSSDEFVIADCDLSGNTSGAIASGATGTHQRISNNVGFNNQKRIFIPAAAFKSAQGAPDEALRGDNAFVQFRFWAWALDPAADEAVTTTVMLNGYSGGAITPVIHWAPATNNVGNVTWQPAWASLASGDQADVNADQTTAFTATSSGVAQQYQKNTGPTFTPTNVGDLIRLSIDRVGTDGGDTFTGDAWFIGVELLYD